MYRIYKMVLAIMLGMQMVSVPVHAEEQPDENDFQVNEQVIEDQYDTQDNDDETEIGEDPEPEEGDEGGEGEEGDEGDPENPGGQEPDEGDPDILPDDPEIEYPEDPEPVIREADQVKRFAGADRYSTGNMLLNELVEVSGIEKFDNIVIASGQQFPDALTGSYLAFRKEAPIILSAKSVSDNVVSFIQNHVAEGGTVYILGGTGAISGDYETKLSGYEVKRLSGKSRYETNLAILEESDAALRDLLVTTGENFADGLSASAVEKPILLVGKKGLTDEQREYLSNNIFRNLYILGGTAAVSEETEAEITELINREATRLSGYDRFATSAAIAREFFEGSRSSFVTDGFNFPDGLSICALAMYYHGPVLLGHTGYDKEAAAYNAENGITTGVVAGGFRQFSEETIRNIFAMDADEEIGGHMDSGFFRLDDGNTYYWDENTKSVLKGRRWINGTEYVLDDVTGANYDWKYINSASNWAFATGSGKRYKGWLYRFHNEYYAGDNTFYLGSDGLRVYGKQTIDGSLYYFAPGSGARQSGWVRIEGSGNYYFDTSTYKGATGSKTINGKTYTFDSQGRYIEFAKAAAVLNSVGWDLRSAYNWCVHNIRYVSITTDASLGIKYFANYGFDNRIGNCYVYAATLYEMAKMLGYVVSQMDGRVGNDWHKHSWLDVYKDGTHWVLDPDYEYELGKSGYFKTYSGGVGIKSYTAMKE